MVEKNALKKNNPWQKTLGSPDFKTHIVFLEHSPVCSVQCCWDCILITVAGGGNEEQNRQDHNMLVTGSLYKKSARELGQEGDANLSWFFLEENHYTQLMHRQQKWWKKTNDRNFKTGDDCTCFLWPYKKQSIVKTRDIKSGKLLSIFHNNQINHYRAAARMDRPVDCPRTGFGIPPCSSPVCHCMGSRQSEMYSGGWGRSLRKQRRPSESRK